MRVCSVEKVVRFHRAIGDGPLKPASVLAWSSHLPDSIAKASMR